MTRAGALYEWQVRARPVGTMRTRLSVVTPADNEQHCIELIARYRRIAIGYRAQMRFEYGFHVPGQPDTYRKVGPR